MLICLNLCKSFAVLTVSRYRDHFSIEDAQHRERNDVTYNSYVITSDHLPLNRNYYPTISNGYIGHVALSDTLFINGLFNGNKGESHKAKVPVGTPRISSLNRKNQYILEMYKNTFTHLSSPLGSDDHGPQFAVTSYTHSVYTKLLVFEISYPSNARSSFFPYTLDIDSHISPEAYDDIDILNSTTIQYNSSFCSNSYICQYLYTAAVTFGRTKTAEEDFSETQDVVVLASKIPSSLLFTFERGYLFFVSVASTLEEAKTFYEAGMKSASSGTLFTTHANNWQKTIMNTSIYVIGNDELDQAIKSSMYYIRSSFPPPETQKNYTFDFYGVGPGGAAHGAAGKNYQGHVFWDQDFWMIPGLLPFFPGNVVIT